MNFPFLPSEEYLESYPNTADTRRPGRRPLRTLQNDRVMIWLSKSNDDEELQSREAFESPRSAPERHTCHCVLCVTRESRRRAEKSASPESRERSPSRRLELEGEPYERRHRSPEGEESDNWREESNLSWSFFSPTPEPEDGRGGSGPQPRGPPGSDYESENESHSGSTGDEEKENERPRRGRFSTRAPSSVSSESTYRGFGSHSPLGNSDPIRNLRRDYSPTRRYEDERVNREFARTPFDRDTERTNERFRAARSPLGGQYWSQESQQLRYHPEMDDDFSEIDSRRAEYFNVIDWVRSEPGQSIPSPYDYQIPTGPRINPYDPGFHHVPYRSSPNSVYRLYTTTEVGGRVQYQRTYASSLDAATDAKCWLLRQAKERLRGPLTWDTDEAYHNRSGGICISLRVSRICPGRGEISYCAWTEEEPIQQMAVED